MLASCQYIWVVKAFSVMRPVRRQPQEGNGDCELDM